MIRQRTPEWMEERRKGITSTDIGTILGLSQYASEADVAREKMGETIERQEVDPRSQRRMRLGLSLEELIRDEEEIEHGIKLRHVNRLLYHPTIPWAMTSLDFERVGEKCIVEVKSSASRIWDDGLPEGVEVQVRWQMGVAQYPKVHVAALRYGSELVCYDVQHDQEVFDNLILIANDFRRRLDAGGPFAENAASVKRRWPRDSGAEMVADSDTVERVHALVDVRAEIDHLEDTEEALETAIKQMMGEVSVLTGPAFRITWRKSKDGSETDWESVASGLLATLSAEDRETVIGLHTIVKPGSRRFIVRTDKED